MNNILDRAKPARKPANFLRSGLGATLLAMSMFAAGVANAQDKICSPEVSINPRTLGISTGGSQSVTNVDISSSFPGFPSGSVLVSGSFRTLSGGAGFVNGVGQDGTFSLSGTQDVWHNARIGAILVLGATDGFEAQDGTGYTSAVALNPGFTETSAPPIYQVVRTGGGGNGGTLAWNSNGPVTSFRYFTTETDFDNAYVPRLLAVCDPQISAAKSAASPSENPDGTYNVTWSIIVENRSDVDLTNLTLSDDVAGQFGAGLVSVSSLNVAMLVSTSGRSTVPLANSGFTPTGSGSPIDGSTAVLGPGDSYQVTFTTTLDPSIVFSGKFSLLTDSSTIVLFVLLST